MLILPAIDLKDGKVVRLCKGDFDTVQKVAEDPVATAKAFYSAGARWIHMVDLDGAKDGMRKNSGIVKAVGHTGLKIELGGGLRSMEDLETVFELGISRAVIGSAAVSHPEFVRAAVKKYGGEHIAVGIDTWGGRVKTSGWIEDSGLDYLEFAKEMISIGVKIIIFTDIETDGTLSGPSMSRLTALQQAVNCDIIASGGVAGNQDICDLAAAGFYGAIIGKAYYAGMVDLAQAVKDGGIQC